MYGPLMNSRLRTVRTMHRKTKLRHTLSLEEYCKIGNNKTTTRS
uniref:Uncharacterized protein n=1 Tax=Anguilla anguilla TaxID=7936 RepID=A0A0E9TMC6_ANGAN